MKAKVLKVSELNGNALSRLANKVPRKFLKQANELCDFLYNNMYHVLFDVTVLLEKEKKHLIVIPHANIAIDMFSYNLDYFWGIEDSDKIEPFLGLDMWCELSPIIAKSCTVDKELHFSESIHYLAINDVIRIKGKRRYISPYLIEKLTGKDYYKKIGILDRKGSYILESRSTLMDLFNIKYNTIYGDYDDEEHKENPFVLEGDKIDLCIYSSNSYITAFSPKQLILREINQEIIPEYSKIEDGRLRYVFITFKWEEIHGIFLDEKNSKNRKKILSFSEEASYPLMFMGIYKYCKKESLQEGLFVWKQIGTKVEVPLLQDEFDQNY